MMKRPNEKVSETKLRRVDLIKILTGIFNTLETLLIADNKRKSLLRATVF